MEPKLTQKEIAWKMFKSTVMAITALAIAYITQNVIPQIDQTNTGGMIAVAVISVVVNYLRLEFGIGVDTPKDPPAQG